MNKNKEKDIVRKDNKQLSHSKKSTNQFKTLYKITKQIRSQFNKMQNHQKVYDCKKQQSSNNFSDSLDHVEIMNEEEEQTKMSKQISKVSNSRGNKKSNHNRSNSCPIVNPLNASTKLEKKQVNICNKHIEDEGKRTLKKISTLHRKNKGINRLNKKYSIGHSQISQESNTVIVHSLPIQQLSSMLYSLNHDKQRSLKKSQSSAYLPKHLIQINNDLYFQTLLQQQIKMYDLNQELKILQKQSENVRIKQQVLEKLANKFQNHETHTILDDSFLIH